MIYPKFIKQNDKIVFVAPSYGCTIEPYLSRVKESYNVFTALGYEVEFGKNVFSEIVGRSNTPDKCAEEINESFINKDTKLILSVGGGELMCEDLPYIDFEEIKNNPKWFMGFSDNTNLTYLITTICDIATVYGPCATSFGVIPWHSYVRDSYEILTGKKLNIKGYGKWEKEELDELPFTPLNLTEDTIMKPYPNDKLEFSGRLLGGCLDVLSNFLGTRFDKTLEFIEKYKEDGIVWFLEACDLSPFSIRRTFHQLDLAGWFKYAKGFVLGRPLNGMEPVAGLDEYEAVLEILKKYNVPIVFDCDLGHFKPSMPLITGSLANVKIENNNIEIKMTLK